MSLGYLLNRFEDLKVLLYNHSNAYKNKSIRAAIDRLHYLIIDEYEKNQEIISGCEHQGEHCECVVPLRRQVELLSKYVNLDQCEQANIDERYRKDKAK